MLYINPQKFLDETSHMSNEQVGIHVRQLCNDKLNKSESDSLHKKFIEYHNLFVLNKIGVAGKYNGMEGKAAKEIIAYITKESKDKSDEGVLNSWKYILDNWQKLDNFTRTKLRLTDINSNLINILAQLRNGQNTKADIHREIEQRIG